MVMIMVQAHVPRSTEPLSSFQEHEATLISTLPPQEAPALITELITELFTEAINSQLSSERLGEPTTNGSGSGLGEQTTNKPRGAMARLSDSTAMGGANTSIDITTDPPLYPENTDKPDWYLLKFLLIVFGFVIFGIIAFTLPKIMR